MQRLTTALIATLFLAIPTVGRAQSAAPAASPRLINEADRVVLTGTVPTRAHPQNEMGRSAPGLRMERVILQLALRPGARQDLEVFLSAQQDPASTGFHHWLTPAEYATRFGLGDADLKVVTDWLTSHGFTVDEVAHGRGWINFSGTVAQIESTFATQMHDYRDGGAIRRANSIEPSIPRGLADLVKGVVSLNGFERRPRRAAPRALASSAPRSNLQGEHFLVPADFATIYDLNQSYNAGINGSGETIAIVARSDIQLSDVQTFRTSFGLAANDPVFVHNGKAPGIVDGDSDEAYLDTEWAGAVAPKATVKLVISASTQVSDGALLSAQYIVDQNLAAVASTSFGLCEADAGSSQLDFYDALLAQASAQGITSFSPAGDSGAADCDDPTGDTGTVQAVDNPCSSPNGTCVGGTQFNDLANPKTFWRAKNNPSTQGSALSYIPELAWNESGPGTADCSAGLWATGGGASAFFSKPSWQVAPGVPADSHRDVPDVALATACHDGFLVFDGGQLFSFSGTSAAAPSFAGIMALVVQKTGSRQGNINHALYQLGAQQYGSGGAAVFHDVKRGNNSVPGVSGKTAAVAYDLVTGLGSVDGHTLLANFSGNTIIGTPAPCVPSPTTLCLSGGRFGVSATFDAGTSGSGNAQVVALSDDTGYLWFFAASNVEAVVKVLNGCGLGGHYWVFAGGLTSVNVVLSVTDSQSGITRIYTNPSNTTYQAIQDTAAFSTCP